MSLSIVHGVRRAKAPDDDSVEQCHTWMTEVGSRRWLAQQQADDAAYSRDPAYAGWIKDRATVIAKRAKTMGMSV